MATSNTKQLLIVVEGGQLVYFELDEDTGFLNEVKTEYLKDITCIDIGDVPAGRLRCRFVAVGSQDRTVRILSLDPESCL